LAAINESIVGSLITAANTQLAAICCMAAVKLKLRGERPDASADWSIVRRIKL